MDSIWSIVVEEMGKELKEGETACNTTTYVIKALEEPRVMQ